MIRAIIFAIICAIIFAILGAAARTVRSPLPSPGEG
jgi:hypothetical protein